MFDFEDLEDVDPCSIEEATVEQTADLEKSDEKNTKPVDAPVMAKDPYSILEVAASASAADIREAYRRQVLVHRQNGSDAAEANKAVLGAYHSLTAAFAKSKSGWRDAAEEQALGPWRAHGRKVSTVIFDSVSAPPWETRRLYTASFNEGKVRRWDLSPSNDESLTAPPRLAGALRTPGFVQDLAIISPGCLVTALSRGMSETWGTFFTWDSSKAFGTSGPEGFPVQDGEAELEPGSAVRLQNLKSAPHLNGQEGVVGKWDADKGRWNVHLLAGDVKALKPEALQKLEEHAPHANDSKVTVNLHKRGVHALSLWPRADTLYAVPELLASASKLTLAVSRILGDGSSIEQAATWSVADPHDNTVDINALNWESLHRVWSGDNYGIIKAWDVHSGRRDACISAKLLPKGAGQWLSSIELWPSAGMLLASHTGGITFFDTRSCKVVRHQYTKESVHRVCAVHQGHPMFFAGIGNVLREYDTRMFPDGSEAKPTPVRDWNCGSEITAVQCTLSERGHILVAAGCLDGRAAVFDAM